ncbi:MAG: glycosyltransferase family 2 protein [Desulfobacterales bacterium]
MIESIGIVVLNWNQQALTRECIGSIRNSDFKNYKIFLLDNGSRQGEWEEFSTPCEDIIFIRNEENLGFARGANIGITAAMEYGCDYLFLLNNDTLIDPLCLSEMMKHWAVDETVGVITPKILQYDRRDTLFAAGGRLIKSLGQPLLRGLNEKDRGQYDKNETVTFASGCAMLIKVSVIREIGMFYEDFFAYAEDMDLCSRVSKQNYKMLYIPTAKVWHKFAGSTGVESPLFYYLHTRNRMIFAKRNNVFLVYFFAFMPFFILYRVLYLITRLLMTKRFSQAKAVFKGFVWHINKKWGQMTF